MNPLNGATPSSPSRFQADKTVAYDVFNFKEKERALARLAAEVKGKKDKGKDVDEAQVNDKKKVKMRDGL